MNITLNSLYQKITDYRESFKYKRKISRIKDRLGKVNQFTNSTNVFTNSVVIIEPNPFHAETLPGYIKYFSDLGYNVDVFITYECAVEKPFARMTESFRIFIGETADIQRWITYDNMNLYNIVFFSTMFYNKKMKFLPPLVGKECFDRVFGVAHNLEQYKDWVRNTSDESMFYAMLNSGHFASLSFIDGLYLINPNYFGNVIEKHKKNTKTTFVTVGSIARCKNYDLLVDTIRDLVANQITNFKIHVIGTSVEIPEDLHDYIVLCGRLDFPSMYAEIEKSDFILALLDPYNKIHQAYLNGTTTGSLQLSYGFLKPLVINALFSEAYSLESNCVINYNDNDLYTAMVNAINMSEEKYKLVQDALTDHRNSVRRKSIESITSILKKG